jgi:hypothetical protein
MYNFLWVLYVRRTNQRIIKVEAPCRKMLDSPITKRLLGILYHSLLRRVGDCDINHYDDDNCNCNRILVTVIINTL